MTEKQRIRALRRLIDNADRTIAEFMDDPMNRAMGFAPDLPLDAIGQPFRRAMRRLKLTRAAAIEGLQQCLDHEALHAWDDPPRAYHQLMTLEDFAPINDDVPPLPGGFGR